jgi:hypothetical protein
MKKLLIIACLFISGLGFSQTEYYNGFISFSAGRTIPLGDFASTSDANPHAQFAKNGSAFSIDGAYFLHKNFGISGSFYSRNWELVKEEFNEVPLYKSQGLMLGGIGTIPLKPRLDLDFTAKAGYVLLSIEQIEKDTKGTSVPHVLQRGTGASIALSAGVGLRYHWKHRIEALFTANFFQTQPELQDEVGEIKITSMVYSFGIGYRL